MKSIWVPEEFSFFLFTLMGLNFAFDIDQIAEIRAITDQQKKDTKMIWLHEKIPFAKSPVSYQSPQILKFKDHQLASDVIIDMPKELITLQIDQIQPMPKLIRRAIPATPLWGISIVHDKIIFLVDPYKMMPAYSIDKNGLCEKDQ